MGQSFVWDRIKPCHSRYGTIETPPFSNAVDTALQPYNGNDDVFLKVTYPWAGVKQHTKKQTSEVVLTGDGEVTSLGVVEDIV